MDNLSTNTKGTAADRSYYYFIIEFFLNHRIFSSYSEQQVYDEATNYTLTEEGRMLIIISSLH